jgi:trimethylamine--corrinoid protein Co-methyltransferase
MEVFIQKEILRLKQLVLIYKHMVDTAFRILEDGGCEINNQEALALLRNIGCTTNGTSVKISQAIVDECISSAPQIVTFYDRYQNPTFTVEPMAAFFDSHLSWPNTADLDTSVDEA